MATGLTLVPQETFNLNTAIIAYRDWSEEEKAAYAKR
jgi:hypothetical protein